MIYTLTLNPAIDYLFTLKNLNVGGVNRPVTERHVPGGKGLNVSIMLTRLGIDNRAISVCGGPNGEKLEKIVASHGCAADFLHLSFGETRINIKLIAEEETEINTKGPRITIPESDMLLRKISTITQNDILVVSGSVPTCEDDKLFEHILSVAGENGVKLVVDAAGDLLKKSLKYKPSLIKPNNIELGEIFGVQINDLNDCIKYSKKIIAMGALSVLCSCGEKGAVYVTADGEIYAQPAFKGRVVGCVGSGDTLLAGFLAARDSGYDYRKALKFAVAAGCATAFSDWLAEPEDIKSILDNQG